MDDRVPGYVLVAVDIVDLLDEDVRFLLVASAATFTVLLITGLWRADCLIHHHLLELAGSRA